VLTSYDTIIRATSAIDPAVTNETINRLYTGFLRLDMKVKITGEAGQTDLAILAPGAEIEFAITYTNISSTAGEGSSLLTAHNIVINQDGNAAPNNWGTTTDHVVGASDNRGGYIIGDREGSTSLTDTVKTLDAGQSGVFKFKRRVKSRTL
jgi:hypothetical protein